VTGRQSRLTNVGSGSPSRACAGGGRDTEVLPRRPTGHLALDSCGWHPFYQGTTLIFSLTSAAIRADTVARGRGRAARLTATVNV
jgi:hypothetical protein